MKLATADIRNLCQQISEGTLFGVYLKVTPACAGDCPGPVIQSKGSAGEPTFSVQHDANCLADNKAYKTNLDIASLIGVKHTTKWVVELMLSKTMTEKDASCYNSAWLIALRNGGTEETLAPGTRYDTGNEETIAFDITIA